MLKVEIRMEGAAFADGGNEELARILRKLADRLTYGTYDEDDYGGLVDINGNTCGGWTLDRPKGDDA